MKSRPRIGTVGELKFVVEEKHVIDFANDGMPAVLSTPNLIGLLERTAREALQPFLEPNERTVGIEIDMSVPGGSAVAVNEMNVPNVRAAKAQRVSDRCFLDVHVKEVAEQFNILCSEGLQQFDAVCDAIDEIGFVPIQRF